VLATNFAMCEQRSEAHTHAYEMILVLLRRLQHKPTYLLYAEKRYARSTRHAPAPLSSVQTAGESTGAFPHSDATTDTSSVTAGADTSEVRVFDKEDADRRRIELLRLTWRVLDTIAPSVRHKCLVTNPELCVLSSHEQNESKHGLAKSPASGTKSTRGVDAGHAVSTDTHADAVAGAAHDSGRVWDVQAAVKSLLEHKAQAV
jgi:hypothetical protein